MGGGSRRGQGRKIRGRENKGSNIKNWRRCEREDEELQVATEGSQTPEKHEVPRTQWNRL